MNNRNSRRATWLLGLWLSVPAMLLGVSAYATTSKTKAVDLGAVQKQKIQKGQAEKGVNRSTRNEAFLVVTQGKLYSEIVKAITFLSKTAEKLPKKGTARLEMREKILNLHLEAAVYKSAEEMRTYDKAWEAWDRGGRKGTEPKLTDAKSKAHWATLAKDAQTLLAEYPRAKNADTTMFNMGLAYNFLKKEKESARIFSQLISKYPNSQKAGDAYFALGDFYFDKTDFRNAMNNYKQSLRFKQSKTYSWSLFKLGWCSYNLQNYRQALAYWKQTVSDAGRTGKQGLALKDEALRDMVYAFAELKQVEPAIAYYRANGGERFIGKFLILLSQTFSDQGQYAEAIKVLKRYQQVEPTDPEVPGTQKEIIALNFELGRFNAVWAELERYPKLFGPNSRWASANQSNAALYKEVQQTIKDQILYYAKLTHKSSQKDDNKKGYVEALRGYNLFLKNYPKAKEVAEVKFNMADIYYFAKQFRESGQLYRDICLLGKDKAIIIDPKTSKSLNIHKDSAEYMLDSYNRDFTPEFKVLIKQKPDFTKPKQITEKAKNFIKACGYYSKWYPGEKKNVKTCDTFITEIFYRSGDKKMAMKYLWMLAKKYPPPEKEGAEAVENLIPLYGQDKKALAKAIGELRKIKGYEKGKLGDKLDALYVGLEKDELGKDKNACVNAKKFEEFYKKYPKDKDAGSTIYNAGLAWVKCGNITEAISAYMIVLKKHPNLPTASTAMLEVAKLQEIRLDLGSAAQYFAEFAKKHSKEKEALGALAKACEIQAALNSGSAVNTCLAFASADANGGRIIFNRMMRTAYSAGDEGRLTNLVRTFDGRLQPSPEERINAYAMIYNINKGQGGAAQQASQQIVGTFQRSGGGVQGEALRAVGGIVFRNVNGGFARFMQVKLRGGTVDNLVASLGQKEAALGQLINGYQQVLGTKDAYWGVAALYQMGHGFEILAEDTENFPDIKGAPRDAVLKELAPRIAGYKKEAAGFYAKALEAVQQFLVYNDWAAKALSGKARLAGKNINFDDLIVRPDFIGAEVPENIASALRGG